MESELDENLINIVSKIFTPELRYIISTIPRDLTEDDKVQKAMEKILKNSKSLQRGTFFISLLLLATIIIDEDGYMELLTDETKMESIEKYIW